MSGFECPMPLRKYPQIVMGHGSGGQMTDDLIEHLFAPAFGMAGELGDAAILDADPAARLAFSTDSFVVNPPIFPGGDIGSLAVAGTVNDLAMMGAEPRYLSAGFVLEEGLDLGLLSHVVGSMAQTAAAAGVRVVTGDTKVVERGHGDGVYINTSGIGVLTGAARPHAGRAEPGDVLMVNGTLGDHGIAIMSLRHGLGLESAIVSDSAPLNDLVRTMLAACPGIHVLRDLTRGGLASGVNEIARTARVGMVIEEARVPVKTAVAGACEILGLDPLQVANEGKLLAILPEEDAERVLEVMQRHPLGGESAIIGRVVAEHSGTVAGQTPFGSQRVIDLPAGELLPRIC